MRPLCVLLALLRTGTPKQPGDQRQQDPWKRNLTGGGKGEKSGEGGIIPMGKELGKCA